MNQPWHGIGFMLMGFLIGLPCGCIAVLAGAAEKKSRAGLAPRQRQRKMIIYSVTPSGRFVKREVSK